MSYFGAAGTSGGTCFGGYDLNIFKKGIRSIYKIACLSDQS